MCNSDDHLNKIKVELETKDENLRERTYKLAEYAIILSGFYISIVQYYNLKIEATWTIRIFMICILLIYALLFISVLPFQSFSFTIKNRNYYSLTGSELKTNVDELYKTVQRNIINHAVIVLFMFTSLILFSGIATGILFWGWDLLLIISTLLVIAGVVIMIICYKNLYSS
ncbi:hypothetical protein SAMN04488589_2798 [Methanolobus vulcani]|uniref:Uncharacterized protein n=1 Tax=Methanolobus vulcani TaxID=38026 RepID=A0A7Z7FDP7_9EURY|nr:hypothetical protein [Methanolobus vulcani]SDG35597.1 hypothetical protein SAMN04488589_2798 [Methanolobus vulcani]